MEELAKFLVSHIEAISEKPTVSLLDIGARDAYSTVLAYLKLSLISQTYKEKEQ